MSDPSETASAESPPRQTADESGRSLFDRDLTTALQGGALAVAVIFALVAAVGFYTSAQRVIRVWVADAYQPVFSMGFNLALLLAMVAVVVLLTRRLTE
ncbi:hypothetical protein [Halorarius litoreus]|uniref:hypothetical protein n=1 Tax=Halorarius litoreus TaxID=2962676 RepID=UPI0020CF7DE0|nr:hypothetical protein [Halorarius litoreus]